MLLLPLLASIQCDNLLDEVAIDEDVCAPINIMTGIKSAQNCIHDEVKMEMHMRALVVNNFIIYRYAHEDTQLRCTTAAVFESGQEGRVQCTRPPSLIPSLILPKHSPVLGTLFMLVRFHHLVFFFLSFSNNYGQ